MRYLTVFLTFVIGLSGTLIVHRYFDYAVDAVPEIRYTVTDLKHADLTESSPEFVPFFESKLNTYFYGWFMADQFEGMREVWTIQLARRDDNINFWEALVRTNPPGGNGDIDKEVVYKSRKIVADRDQLTFVTEKIRGIHYEFKGQFLFGGSMFTNGEKVLKGTLTKYARGKRVAEISSTFEYAEPYCLH